MAILTVGSGKEYSTIAQAVNASQNGDVIMVNAGTYTNDFLNVNNSVTIEAVGGKVTLTATEPPPNDKGIITVGDAGLNPNVTIEGFAVSGAVSSSSNGAGVRYESGNLTLVNDTFTNDQDGILATPYVWNTGTVTVENSTFANDGAGDGQSHNLYIGYVKQFNFINSVSTGAIEGHDIKSRAYNTDILNSYISDGPTGTGSYEIDLPNGGNALIQGNTIEQGPNTHNPIIIAYGEEGSGFGFNPGSLTVNNNVILNDLNSFSVAINNLSTNTAVVENNRYLGLSTWGSQLTNGPVAVSNNISISSEPPLVYQAPAAPWPPAPAQTISASNTRLSFLTQPANALVTGSNDLINMGSPGGTLVVTGAGAVVQTSAGATDNVTLSNSGWVLSAGNDTIQLSAAGDSVVAQQGSTQITTSAGATDHITLDNGGSVSSAGQDTITTLAGSAMVEAQGTDIIHANAANIILTGMAGSSSTVYGGSGQFSYSGDGALDFIARGGQSTINTGAGAAQIQFGSGTTNLTVGSGLATLLFVNGQGGGNDVISGYNPSTDKLSFQGFNGSPIRSETVSWGTTYVTLTDNTNITFLNAANIPLPS